MCRERRYGYILMRGFPMPQLETYSTSGLEPRRRIEYWNDLACQSITELAASPLNRRDFSGRLMRTALLEIALSCGFNHRSDFRRVFRQRSGVTPSEFRARGACRLS
jgi:AraC-like DNA-binding protein